MGEAEVMTPAIRDYVSVQNEHRGGVERVICVLLTDFPS